MRAMLALALFLAGLCMRLVAAQASASSTAPQWSKYRGNSLSTGYTTVVSSIGLNPSVGWKYATSGDVASSPALGPDGTLYFGSDDRNLYAVNASNGYFKWSMPIDGFVSSSPAVSADGSRVYVGSDAADLTLLQSMQTTVCCTAQEGQMCVLSCPLPSQVISQIDVASFGTPTGSCSSQMTVDQSPVNYLVYTSTLQINPACDAFDSEPIVSDPCLTQRTCSLLASNTVFSDACPGQTKILAVTASCVVEDINTLPMVGLTKASPPLVGNRILFVPTLPSNYYFRFQIFPQADTDTRLRNIFQFDSFNEDTQRLPSIFFCDGQGTRSRSLCIQYLSGVVHDGITDSALYLTTRPLPLNVWTTVTVVVDLIDLQSMQVTLSGGTRGTYEVAFPPGRSVSGLVFTGVNLFFSSPFYPAALCSVRDFTLANNFDTWLDAYNTGDAVLPENRLAWRLTTVGYLLSSPALQTDGSIVIGSMSRRIYSISAAGAEMWQFETAGAVQSSAAIASDGTIFIGDDSGAAYSLTASGALLWKYQTGNWIYGAPAIYPTDGSVIFGSADNFLYRFKKVGVNGAGQLIWRAQVSGGILGSPAIQPSTGNIVCATDLGVIYLLGIDGNVRWQFSVGANVAILASPIIGGDGMIYVGADDGLMRALTLSGALAWSVTTQGSLEGEAALGSDGNLYFGSGDANMYQLTKTRVVGALATFNYTGFTQMYTVPAATFTINIVAYGAQGAYPGGDATKPGMGGMLSATVSVTPGMQLKIDVGQQPPSDSNAPGGYNGGGVGRCNGGGGGGMSSIYITNTSVPLGYTFLVVAGGGGGCGYYGCLGNGLGGAGGQLVGGSGSVNTYAGATSGCQGGGGSQKVGGAGGVSSGTASGSPGSFGKGGGSSTSMMCSAGGGGGYYGGGGSAGGCGGGGGSSYVNSAFRPVNLRSLQGVQMGHGFVTIQVAGSPTAAPTRMPSPEPTDIPTNVPVANPALKPTVEPTPAPTPVVTAVPSLTGSCQSYKAPNSLLPTCFFPDGRVRPCDTQMVLGDDGAVSCSRYCAGHSPTGPSVLTVNATKGSPTVTVPYAASFGVGAHVSGACLPTSTTNPVTVVSFVRATATTNPVSTVTLSQAVTITGSCVLTIGQSVSATVTTGAFVVPVAVTYYIGVGAEVAGDCVSGDTRVISVNVNSITLSQATTYTGNCLLTVGGASSGSSWNNELPNSWGGAICISAGKAGNIPCTQVGADPATPGKLNCKCMESPSTPWGIMPSSGNFDTWPSNPTCAVRACGGDAVLLTTCPGKGSAQCLGDTFLRLFDTSGTEVAMNDDAGSSCPANPKCAEISWTPPGDRSQCDLYTLRQGCGGNVTTVGGIGCVGQVYAAGADLRLPQNATFTPAPTAAATLFPSYVANAPTPAPTPEPTVVPSGSPTPGPTGASGMCPLYLGQNTNSDSRALSSTCGITAKGGATFTVSLCSSTFPRSGATCSGATVLRLFAVGGVAELPVTQNTNWQCGTCAEFSYTVPAGTPMQQYIVVEGCVGLLSCTGVAVIRGGGFTVQPFMPSALPTMAPTPPVGSPTIVPITSNPSALPTFAPTSSLLCPAYRTSGTSTDVFNTRSCGVTLCSGESVTASMCSSVFAGATCSGPTTLRLMDQQGNTLVLDDGSLAQSVVCQSNPTQGNTRCAQISYTAPITSGCQVYQLKQGCIGMDECSGIVGVGMTIERPLLTPQPSLLPTLRPTYVNNSPTPKPSAQPTIKPSAVATVTPTRVLTCPLYQQNRNTFNDLVNVASCGITACAGVPFTVSLCGANFPGASCSGNTFLRLFDSSNTMQLAMSDNALTSACNQCSQLSYTPPANTGCQLYLLREGCSGAAPCSGTAVVSGAGFNVVTYSPTLQPSFAPTYRQGRPTPRPTVRPTQARICNQYNSDSNVMACGINTCSGDAITISFCSGNFQGAYCTGDVNIRLLSANGTQVAINDNGPGKCGLCSQLTYTPPMGSECQTYRLVELCSTGAKCTGQAIVAGPAFQIVPYAPTFFPSPAPSYLPQVPTPLPTTSVPSPMPTSGVPSSAPVISPTLEPTLFPSPVPSSAPSPWPTSVPTLAPSGIKLCPAYEASKTSDATTAYSACGVMACGNQTFLATTCSARAAGAVCSGSSNTRLRIYMDPAQTGGAVREVLYDTVAQLSQQNGVNPCPCGATVQYTPPKSATCQTYTVVEGCIGAGTCTGTVAIVGTSNVVAFAPTVSPTPYPTYLLHDPTPSPTVPPTVVPTALPTMGPTMGPTGKTPLLCKLYTAVGTANDGVSMPVCGVTACGNQTFTVSLCGGNFPGASCRGNTFLRLFDQTNTNLLVSSDSGINNCGPCAQITYTPPPLTQCQTYIIREGCDLAGRCAGTAVIVGGSDIKLVTYAPTTVPTTAPTYGFNLPTPAPSQAPLPPPSMMPSVGPTSPGPTMLRAGEPTQMPTWTPTFNALRCPLFGEGGQMPSCQFTLCAGKSVNITTCPNEAFAGAYCMGDVSLKVYSTTGVVVASGDTGTDPSCGMCPQLHYTAPPGQQPACRSFTLREFCASGSCSGVAALLTTPGDGTSLMSGVPSAQPTPVRPKATSAPTYLPGKPTPVPSVNIFPTAVPTIAPSLQQFCPPFSAFNTNSAQNVSNTAQCSITACGGQTLVAGCCAPDGSQFSCHGDTYLRLLDSNLQELKIDDDSCGNGGSRITYAVPIGIPCSNYVLRQGCFENTRCGGTSNVIGGATVTTTPPTYAPTPRPSPPPVHPPVAAVGVPTPVPSVHPRGLPTKPPTPAPSALLQSCAVFSAVFTNSNEDNYATCGVYACAGATFTVSNCASTYAGAFCSGDAMLSLTDANEVRLTGNDDGPVGCGRCSQFTFTATGPCQTYVIRQGCKGNSGCTGQTMVSDANNDVRVQTFSPTLYTTRRPSAVPSQAPSLPPTWGPSMAPTYLKGSPTPQPTFSPTNPTSVPTPAPTLPPVNPTPAPSFSLMCPQYTATKTQNALLNYAACGIYACAGAVVTMGGCDSLGQPMGSCVGDEYLRLYDGSNFALLAFNDDGPQGCGKCASITYTFTQPCQNYQLVQGCADETTCGGVSAVIGSGTFSLSLGSPSQLPTQKPSTRLPPTYMPKSPTPRPSARPTFLPAAGLTTCALFQSDGTSTDNFRYGTCGVYLCPGTTIMLSTCPNVPGGACTGDTYLKLLAQDGQMVAENGDGPPGCGSCSQITFTSTLPCQAYTIAEGCVGAADCSGTVSFVGTAGSFQIATFLPTLQPTMMPSTLVPTLAPTYLPGRPTPLPTPAPSAPTMPPTPQPSNPTTPPTAPPTFPGFCPPFSVTGTNNALDGNYATCSVSARPGTTLTLGNCDATGQNPGRGCRGDQFFRLYNVDGTPVAFNDDACGFCSQIVYQVPADLRTNQTYVLREGCNGMQRCSGVVTVTGGTINPVLPSRMPTPMPTSPATAAVSGSAPVTQGTPRPSRTPSPTFAPLSCLPYAAFGTSSDKTSFMTCGLYACAGATFTVSTCPNVPGALCMGDTYLQLWDASNTMIAFNDDGPEASGCGTCAELTVTTTGPCQNYVIREGCHENTVCSGTVRVFGNSRNQAAIRMLPEFTPTMTPTQDLRPTLQPSALPSIAPTFGPSVSPTYLPNVPTPLPTVGPTSPTHVPSPAPSSPTALPTLSPTFSFFCPPYDASNTNNDYANYAICSFYACPGAVITVGNCDSDGLAMAKSSYGDTWIRLYDASGQELASNDDSCGQGSTITYTVTEPCQVFGLHEGCFANGACGATMMLAAAGANGILLGTMYPSQLPTALPSAGYVLGSPTLAPVPLTPAPTRPFTSVVCSLFQKSALAGHNYPFCRFYACPGTQIKISTCPSSGVGTLAGYCHGSVYLKLYDGSNQLVQANSAGPASSGCGGCPEITYGTPSGQCQFYTIKEGCNSATGSCAGEVVLTGPDDSFTLFTAGPSPAPVLEPSLSPIVFPTPVPSTAPTAGPTMMDGVPTPAPTVPPTAPITMAPSGPTFAPSIALNACPPYQAFNTSSAVMGVGLCTFTACAHDKVTVGSCGNKDGLADDGVFTDCLGDQVLRLLNAKGFEVAMNDDACGLCSQISYQVPNGTACQTYTIKEGCYGNSQCTGIVGVQGAALAYIPFSPTTAPSLPPVHLPTATPSTLPTAFPTTMKPTPMPTAFPSVEPTPAPSTLPSAMPSPVPTSAKPSTAPTLIPTTGPGEPSRSPTPEPTPAPSDVPTPLPSAIPSTVPSPHPTVAPTTLPSAAPTHESTQIPSHPPSPAPSALPSPEVSIAPTIFTTGVPTSRLDWTCPDFSVSNTDSGRNRANSAICNFYSCASNSILLSTCGLRGGGLARGHTHLTLFDQSGVLLGVGTTAAPAFQYSMNVVPPTTCAEISFTTSSAPGCQVYTLVQGCNSNEQCAGTTAIYAYGASVSFRNQPPTSKPSVMPTASPMPSSLPTAHPTTMPTAHPSPRPSPRPTARPSRRPTPHPSTVPTARPSSGTNKPSPRPSNPGDTTDPTARPTIGVPTRRPSSLSPTKSAAPTIDYSGDPIFSFTPETSELTPNPIWGVDTAGNDWGSTATFSPHGSGSVLVLGASAASADKGTVKVFSCSAAGCTFVSRVDGPDSMPPGELGWDIQAAGNIITVSAPGSFKVDIFNAATLLEATSASGAIAQPLQTVMGTNERFGRACALWAVPGWQADTGTQHVGMILAVSDDMASNGGKGTSSKGTGHVFLYVSTGDAANPWVLSQTLRSPGIPTYAQPSAMPDTYFGDQLSFSSEGILAVGVGGSGNVYLYDCDQLSLMCSLMHQGIVVPPVEGAPVLNEEGKVTYSLGLSHDTLLIGRPTVAGGVGAVYVYGLDKVTTSMAPTAVPTVPPSRLAIDPEFAPTAAPSSIFASYSFNLVMTLHPDPADTSANFTAGFGTALVINDNNIVAISATGANNGLGTVYVYHCTAPGECHGKDGAVYFEKLDCYGVDCAQGTGTSSALALSQTGYVLAKGNVAARRPGMPPALEPGNVQIYLATGGKGAIPLTFAPTFAPTEIPTPEPSPMPSDVPVEPTPPTARDVSTMFNCSFTVLQVLSGPSLGMGAVDADFVDIHKVLQLTIAQVWGYNDVGEPTASNPDNLLLPPNMVRINSIVETPNPKRRALLAAEKARKEAAETQLGAGKLVQLASRRLTGNAVPLFSVLVNYTVTFDYVHMGFERQSYQAAYAWMLTTLRHHIEGYTAVMPTDDPDASMFTQELQYNAPPESALKSAFSAAMIPEPVFVAHTATPTAHPTPFPTSEPSVSATPAPSAFLAISSATDDKTTKNKSKANISLIAGATVGGFVTAMFVLWYYRHVTNEQRSHSKGDNEDYPDDESLASQNVNPIYRNNQGASRIEFGGEADGVYNDAHQSVGPNFGPQRRASGWNQMQQQQQHQQHYQQQQQQQQYGEQQNPMQMPPGGFIDDFASSNPAFNIVKPASSLQPSIRNSITRLVPQGPTIQLPMGPQLMAQPTAPSPVQLGVPLMRPPGLSSLGPVPGAAPQPFQRLPPGQLTLPQNLPTGVLQSGSAARLPPASAIRPFSPTQKQGLGAAGRMHEDL